MCALACDLLPPWRSSSASRARVARGALVPWPASTQQSIDTSVLECCVARGHAASACGLMLKAPAGQAAWECCGIVGVCLYMFCAPSFWGCWLLTVKPLHFGCSMWQRRHSMLLLLGEATPAGGTGQLADCSTGQGSCSLSTSPHWISCLPNATAFCCVASLFHPLRQSLAPMVCHVLHKHSKHFARSLQQRGCV